MTSDGKYTLLTFDEVYKLLPDHTESFYPFIYPWLGFDLASMLKAVKAGHGNTDPQSQNAQKMVGNVHAVVKEGDGEGKKIPRSRMLRERGSKRRHEEKVSL